MAAESPIVAEFLREERPPLQCRWNALPKAVRDAIGSERQWISLYHKHSLLHQHEYDPYVSSDEAAYLEEVLRSSRERCMLYPYHLAADLSRLKQHTPFEYYLEMMYETIRQEKSYDTIPNFTAADCMRLLRVGRNEFLHAMNNCRSKGWMWKRRRALILRQMPARPPDDLPVEHWWHVWATDAAPGLLEAAARGRAATWSLAAASKRMSLSATTAPIEAASSVEASVGGGGRSGEASASTSSMKGPPIEDDDEGAETPRREGTLSLLERDALQALLAAGGVKRAGEMERGALAELYAAGAVRYHVPVEEDDRLAVPPLKGFVMNRVGHDYVRETARPQTKLPFPHPRAAHPIAMVAIPVSTTDRVRVRARVLAVRRRGGGVDRWRSCCTKSSSRRMRAPPSRSSHRCWGSRCRVSSVPSPSRCASVSPRTLQRHRSRRRP